MIPSVFTTYSPLLKESLRLPIPFSYYPLFVCAMDEKRKERLLFCILKKNTQKPNKWWPIQEDASVYSYSQRHGNYWMILLRFSSSALESRRLRTWILNLYIEPLAIVRINCTIVNVIEPQRFRGCFT
jgi:hypothetical protein